MDFVWDDLVTWLLEKMTKSFDTISGAMLGIFNLDISTFFDVFTLLKGLYTVFFYFGLGLVVLIGVAKLFQNISGLDLEDMEDPGKILIRMIIAIALIINAQLIMKIPITIVSPLYNAVNQNFTKDDGTSFSSDMSFSAIADLLTAEAKEKQIQKNIAMNEAVSENLGIVEASEPDSLWSRFTSNFLTAINMSTGSPIGDAAKANAAVTMAKTEVDEIYGDDASETIAGIVAIFVVVAIFFNYFKLLLEAAERYVVISLMNLFAPMLFSTYASRSTEKTFKSFLKIYFNQLLLMVFNLVFVYGTVQGLVVICFAGSSIGPEGGGIVKTLGLIILILAFLIAGQKMDQYMKEMGLDVVQTGGVMNEIQSAARTVGGALRTGFTAANRIPKMFGGRSGAGRSAAGRAGATGSGAGRYGGIMGALQRGSDGINKAKADKAMEKFSGAMPGSMSASDKKNGFNALSTATKANAGKDADSNTRSTLNNLLGGKNNLRDVRFNQDGKGLSYVDGNGNKGNLSFGDQPLGRDGHVDNGYKPLLGADGKQVKTEDGQAIWTKNNNPSSLLGVNEGKMGEKYSVGQDGSPLSIDSASRLGFDEGYKFENLGNGAFRVTDENDSTAGILYSNASTTAGNFLENSGHNPSTTDEFGNTFAFMPSSGQRLLDNEANSAFAGSDTIWENPATGGLYSASAIKTTASNLLENQNITSDDFITGMRASDDGNSLVLTYAGVGDRSIPLSELADCRYTGDISETQAFMGVNEILGGSEGAAKYEELTGSVAKSWSVEGITVNNADGSRSSIDDALIIENLDGSRTVMADATQYTTSKGVIETSAGYYAPSTVICDKDGRYKAATSKDNLRRF